MAASSSSAVDCAQAFETPLVLITRCWIGAADGPERNRDDPPAVRPHAPLGETELPTPSSQGCFEAASHLRMCGTATPLTYSSW